MEQVAREEEVRVITNRKSGMLRNKNPNEPGHWACSHLRDPRAARVEHAVESASMLEKYVRCATRWARAQLATPMRDDNMDNATKTDNSDDDASDCASDLGQTESSSPSE